jgi:hypothetical protein
MVLGVVELTPQVLLGQVVVFEARPGVGLK